MARSELLVGLDIGTTKICAVVGEPNENGGIDIIGIGSSPSNGLRKGVVVNIEQTVQSINKALEDAKLMAGCDIGTVYAGIAGSHITGFNSHGVIAVKGGEVTARDIERALDAAKAIAMPLDRQIIHVLPQEYIVDAQTGIADPLGMAGVRLEVNVHIVTGAVTSASNIVNSCRRSGLEVADIVLESLASAKAVLSDEEREIGVALVDLGGGTSDIAIFVKDSIQYTGVVALGGQNLTNDIAFGLRTPMASAERIKKDFGCAIAEMVRPDEYIEVPSVGGRDARRVSRQVLAEICEPRMEELLTLIDQELIRSGYKNQIGAGVVLTGGTSLIQGCQDLAEQIFDLPTRIGYPRCIDGLKDMVNDPKYATAVGLLCFGEESENVEQRFDRNASDESIVNSVFGRMRKWFNEIS